MIPPITEKQKKAMYQILSELDKKKSNFDISQKLMKKGLTKEEALKFINLALTYREQPYFDWKDYSNYIGKKFSYLLIACGLIGTSINLPVFLANDGHVHILFISLFTILAPLMLIAGIIVWIICKFNL